MAWLNEHRAKKAEQAYKQSLDNWQADRDAYAELVDIARDFEGTGSSEIVLAKGETLFLQMTSCALIEERATGGHYEGRSSGFSFPVASIGGRSIRYRVGASRGHFVAGAPAPTSIDTGTVFITNQRVIFAGTKQTRECKYAKLVGFQHGSGSTTFSVSNRQKPTTIYYGPQVSDVFDFRLELGLAHFRGTVPDLVAQVEQDLAQVDGRRPIPPAGLPT
jgi:hypothetical protein